MLKDLTREKYIEYKRRKLKDKEIARLIGTNTLYLTRWKAENGLKGFTLSKLKEMPEEIERLKKIYLACYRKGWTDEHIAEEMKMTQWSYYHFKSEHFPEHKRKSPRLFTKEEVQIIESRNLTREQMCYRMRVAGMTFEEAIQADIKMDRFTTEQLSIIKEKGLSLSAVRKRVQRGMTFEKAITKPFKTFNQYPIKYKLLAEKNGINWVTALNRVNRGKMDIETACTKPIEERRA